MKLHHLRLKGIGPFRDEVEVDFTALGVSGVFLLEGPTGSGKSTVLDAIVYALYGGVAGEATSGDRIRSHFADPSEVSKVDLIFETHQGIYRILRYPAYERPKKRGSGTVREHEKAVLWRIGSPDLIPAVVADSAGAGAGLEPISARLDEIGREITRALGLSRVQFTQTVLLPQNEFARFLRAGTGDRQEVLQRVFGTEMYARVEKQLEEMRKNAKRDVEQMRGSLTSAVARLHEAAGPDAELDPELPTIEGVAGQDADAGESVPTTRLQVVLHAAAERLDAETLRTQANALTQRLEQVHATHVEEHTQRHEAEKAARSAADHAAAALTAIRRRAELDVTRQRLTDAQSDIDDARHQIALDTAARPVVEALARQRTAEQKTEQAQQAWREQHTLHVNVFADLADRLPQGDLSLTSPLADESERNLFAETADAVDMLEREESAAATAAGELSGLVALEKGLPARREALTHDEKNLESIAKAVATIIQQLEQLPEARQAMVEEREAATKAAEGMTEASLAVKAAEEVKKHADAAHALSAQIAEAEQVLKETVAAAAHAAERESALRQRRYAGLAAELAMELTPGDPCPVCGSTEHPLTAAPADDHVTAEEVEEAEEARRAADHAVQTAEHVRDQRRATQTELRDKAGNLSPDQAAEKLLDATQHLAAVQGKRGAVRQVEQRIAEHDALVTSTTTELHAWKLKHAELDAAIKAAKKSIADDEQKIAEAGTTSESLSERHAAFTARSSAARRLRTALTNYLVQAQQESERRAETANAYAYATQHLAELLEAMRPLDLLDPAHVEVSSVPVVEEDKKDPPPASVGTEGKHPRPTLPEDPWETRSVVLEASVRRHLQDTVDRDANERRRWRDAMTDPAIAHAPRGPHALASAEEELQRATDTLREASADREATAGKVATSASRRDATRSAAEALVRLTEQAEEIQDSAGAIVRVADLATGTSSDSGRIRLSTYVLMRRFEQVIHAANTRLARFAGAHLELVRDTGARGARKTGLDLLVIDRRTDQRRVPETLSGGETFFVSLALALGLADVVSSEAGGVHMDTLFIDEGFGSLDPESLDSVIAEIGRLADHGRTIGVVSHVGEMKTQIPEQIRVRRTAQGHSTLTVVA